MRRYWSASKPTSLAGSTETSKHAHHPAGKVAYDRTYKRDYDKIYSTQAHETNALNAHDPGGPYGPNPFRRWATAKLAQ